MYLLSIKQFFAGETIPALCWTLIHSLWQGLLLAVAASIILLCTKRSTPALRYNLLTGAFLFFIIGILFTFYMQLNKVSGNENVSATIITGLTEKSTTITTSPLIENQATITATVTSFFNRNANVIVFVWFLIMLFRCSRMISGLYSIHRIKRRQVSDPGIFWNERIQILSAKLRVNKTVKFLQSGIATIPMVVGYFKPVILFPAGLLASLPQDEVEAILLHELAHVRRKDYLVNILQHFMEVFFFFNPAAIWVSALIKTERENCCDDIAVSQTRNKLNYINALIAFQEYSLGRQQYATALAGNKDHLLQRVKRIIYNNNKTLNAMEKLMLASGLAIAGLLALAFSPNETRPYAKGFAANQTSSIATAAKIPDSRHVLKDTVPVTVSRKNTETGVDNINTMVDGKRYDLQLKNDEVTALRIDGERIPDEKIADYKTITGSIIKQAKENIARDRLVAEKDKQEAARYRSDAENSKLLIEKLQQQDELLKLNDKKSMQEHLAKLQAQQSKLYAESANKLKDELKMEIDKSTLAELAKLQEQQLKLNLDYTKKLTSELKLETGKLTEHEAGLTNLKIQQELVQLEMSKELAGKLKSMTDVSLAKELKQELLLSELSTKDAARSKADAAQRMHLSEQLRSEAEKNMNRVKQSQAAAKSTSNDIIDDLVREHIITDKKNISFSLNQDELIVNGVKQPEAIHQKLKEKYVKTSDWNFSYNNKEE